jgi:sporulation integral membrane protein YlbJ
MAKLLGRPAVRDGLLGLALLMAAIALVVYPEQAMEAARSGLKLCGNTIIPSLFPFFVLSSLVVELGFAQYLGRALEPVMWPLFRVSGPCASAVVLGFIGGYPVGARTAIALYEKGLCSKTEAQRLLSFCNNSGPAFILGVVGAGVFASSRAGLLLYLVHILASLCVGLVFRFYPGEVGERSDGPRRVGFQTTRFSVAFTRSMKGALTSTLNICAFVVFFTVVIRLLFHSGALTALAEGVSSLLGVESCWVEFLLTGLIELSTGVTSLAGTGALAGRLSMAAFMLGWAGVSVHCQVLAFLGDSGLSMRTYLVGKALHGGFSAVLLALLSRFLPESATAAFYLAEQTEAIAQLDTQQALAISAAAAWGLWLGFFLLSAHGVRRRR